MAGNEWINGYLEAILDAGRYDTKRRGNGKIGGGGGGVANEIGGNEGEGSLFSPTRYFVEEVVNSFDESDLHKTWIKVIILSLSLTYNIVPYVISYLSLDDIAIDKKS